MVAFGQNTLQILDYGQEILHPCSGFDRTVQIGTCSNFWTADTLDCQWP